MRRRLLLLLLSVVLVPACTGAPASAAAAPTPATAPPAPTPATAPPAPTAARDPRIPTATPAPPLPPEFPALEAGRAYVYVVDYYSTIRVVDPGARAAARALPIGRGALPVFSPDGAHLYVAHYPDRQGARLDVFDVAAGRLLARADGLEVMAYKIWGPPILAPTPDGRAVYAHGRRMTSRPGEMGRDTCWIYAFDVGTDRLAPETIPLPDCRVAPLVASADGRTLYLGRWLVDLTARPAAARENPDLADRAVARSGDGRWLYALGRRGDIAVWDADARRAVRTLPGAVPPYGSAVYLMFQSLQLSADGARLFVATDDGDTRQNDFKAIVVLGSAHGERLGEVRLGHTFRHFAVSPDGTSAYVLAPSADGSGEPTKPTSTLEIWDLAAGARRATVSGFGGSAGPVLVPPPPRQAR